MGVASPDNVFRMFLFWVVQYKCTLGFWVWLVTMGMPVYLGYLVSPFIVIQALVALVQDPEPEHPLRADLAEEFTKNKAKFMKNADEFTKKHAEKRPSD